MSEAVSISRAAAEVVEASGAACPREGPAAGCPPVLEVVLREQVQEQEQAPGNWVAVVPAAAQAEVEEAAGAVPRSS